MNLQELWWSTKLSKLLKNRRKKVIENIIGDIYNQNLKILDVGCGTGKDFINYYKDNSNISFTGVDIDKYEINQKNAKFLQLDAQKLPFKDNEFDICVSIGVLEHISPIEKLCDIISEIERVGKKYVIVVPCINTPFEPHTRSIYWQLRGMDKKKRYSNAPLNYFSDESWISFSGFKNAKTKRFWYISFIKSDLIIYN